MICQLISETNKPKMVNKALKNVELNAIENKVMITQEENRFYLRQGWDFRGPMKQFLFGGIL